MGWSSGANYEGRTIGYGHRSTCEHPGCDEPIDLGLGYCCGGIDGVNGEAGCGHYFCGEHLFHTGYGQRCEGCLATPTE